MLLDVLSQFDFHNLIMELSECRFGTFGLDQDIRITPHSSRKIDARHIMDEVFSSCHEFKCDHEAVFGRLIRFLSSFWIVRADSMLLVFRSTFH